MAVLILGVCLNPPNSCCPLTSFNLAVHFQLPVSSNLFDTFGGGGSGGSGGGGGGTAAAGSGGMSSLGTGSNMVVPQMSASCPANVKNEMGVMSPGQLAQGCVCVCVEGYCEVEGLRGQSSEVTPLQVT